MLKSLPLLSLIIISFFFACKSDAPTQRIESVEFNIDSTYFDFAMIDTSESIVLPRIKGWKQDEANSNILWSESENMQLLSGSEHLNHATSYKKYKLKYAEDKSDMLDLSQFLKDDQKLTQLILKDDEWTTFKLMKDIGLESKFINIKVKNEHYVEQNIRLIESIFGLIQFTH